MSTFTDIATESPLEAYLRLRGDGGSFLLESVEHGRLGRHSFVGRGTRIVSFEEAETCGEPVVGYLAYDHVARLEPTVPLPADGPPFPESRFLVADELIRFEHGADTPRLPAPPAPVHRPVKPSPAYEELVRRAQEHIVAGDVFQVVLSQRVERPTSASPVELYRALRLVNPSPYLFLLELDGLALIGSSPETLVKVEDGRATVNPIAGTAAPGHEDELLRSEKDKAEHVMLVDLGRNDLSRVCRPGTVRVQRFMQPERFSHVSHLVSEVTGELSEGGELLRSSARLLPRRDRLGRAEGAGDAVDLRARGVPARAVRRGGRLRAARRDARHMHRHPDDRAGGRARAPAGRGRDRRRLRSRRRARGVPREAGRARAGDRAGGGGHVILLIDNYDSFTYNLAHLFGELGADVVVRRNDAIDAHGAERLDPSHLVVSPGPGRPAAAGATVEILRRLAPSVPTLGVCLGHQALAEAFGGEVGPARELVHGKAATVEHDGRGLFTGLPHDLTAGRYHSLAVTRVPDEFEVSATAADGEVMAMRHRDLRIDGIQFHPESVLTPHGSAIALNFLEGR